MRTGLDAHGLAVLVAVHLDNSIEALLEGIAVGGKADYGQYEGCVVLGCGGAADLEDFRGIAGVDVVARCRSSVASEDGKVGARDGEGGTTVVGISADIVRYAI